MAAPQTSPPPPSAPPKTAILPPLDAIAAFCRKWQFTHFSLFGSVLRNDFRPDSDVDAMVVFDDAARPRHILDSAWVIYER